MSRICFLFAGLSGALAVALGAWSAHGAGLDDEAARRLAIALRYQGWHTAALLALAVALRRRPAPGLRLAAAAFMLGILLFAGSLQAAALLGLGFLTGLTPFGGMALIAGWLAVAWHGAGALRRRSADD